MNPEGVTLLAEYVGADESDMSLERCWQSAAALVHAFVGTADVPAPIIEQATLMTAAELFQRKSAPNGIVQFATPDGGTGMRVARDPMLSAYPLLRRFVGLGFGG